MTPPTPPLTIYFIEDDADNFLIFQRYLRLAGVIPPRVGSGTTGYTLFRWMETRAQVPDLIFLDLRLQQGDGFQVLADIQSHPQLHHTRVIAVTALVQELARCRVLGFDGFLGKPLDPTRIVAQLHAIFAGQAIWDAGMQPGTTDSAVPE